MLGASFVSGGFRAVLNPAKFAAETAPVTDRVATAVHGRYPGFPTDAHSLVRINGAVQLAAGLLLASGRARRPAAVVLAASLVPTTVARHSFWSQRDPDLHRQHEIHFLKNVSVLGGLLMAAVDTEGRPGLMWRAEHLARDTRRSAQRTTRDVRRQAKAVRWGTRPARWAARVGVR